MVKYWLTSGQLVVNYGWLMLVDVGCDCLWFNDRLIAKLFSADKDAKLP